MKNNKMILLQNKLQKEKGFLLSLFLIFFLVSCQTTSISPDFSNDYLEVHKGSYSYYINKIDLETENLQIICQIDTTNFFTLEEFVQQTGATYAINSTPFAYNETNTPYLLGITKFNNKIYTAPVEKYSALGFYFNDQNKIRGKIIEHQTETELQEVITAFGGYFTILKNNEIMEFKNIKRSRTACGLDKEGRYLYVMSVISNSKFDRSGMSYMECAEILRDLGCQDAIQFDGGHSTALISPQSSYVHSKINRKIPACFGFFTK